MTTTLLESDDLAPGERWVTIRGNAVKINSDGEIVSGPAALKGKDLDGGEPDSNPSPRQSLKLGRDEREKIAKGGMYLHGTAKDFDTFNAGGHGAIYFSDPSRDPSRVTQAEHIADGPYGGRLLAVKIDNTNLKRFDPLNDETSRKVFTSLFPGKRVTDYVEYPDMPDVVQAASKHGFNDFKVYEPAIQGFSRAITDPKALSIVGKITKAPTRESIPPIIPTKWRDLSKTRESLHESRTPTLDDLRTASEAKLKRILAGLDKRHRKQLEAAIVEYGGVRNIPEIVWQQIQWEIEDETAAAIVLLMVAADEWTEDELRRQGVAGVELNTQARLGRYVPSAIQQAHTTAAVTTATTRARLERKITDALLDEEMGGTGTLTKPGIRKALDDVFTDSRRETLATDSTTGGFSTGQKGAAERLGGDGAATEAGQKVTIELRWQIENDDRTCSRCRPLHDQPEEVWGKVFPNGPGYEAHPNCRCWLRSVVVVEAVSESFRESEDEEGRWVTLDNGTRVKIDADGEVTAGPKGLKGTDLDGGDGKPKIKMLGAEHNPPYQPPTETEIEDRVNRSLQYRDTFSHKQLVKKLDGKKATLKVSTVDYSDDENAGRVVVDKQGRYYTGNILGDEPLQALPADKVGVMRKAMRDTIRNRHKLAHQRSVQFDKPAEKLAQHISDKFNVPVSIEHPHDSNSRYVYVDVPAGGQFKIRFADHPQPRDWQGKEVGGFDTSKGKRHTASDISIDTDTGHKPSDAIKALATLLRSGGNGQIHESVIR